MKPVYTVVFAIGVCIMVNLPLFLVAQCTCSDGSAATPIVNTLTLSPTSQSSASLNFPKMDPSIGDLYCLKLDYNLSAQSISGARNLAPSTALLPPGDPQYSPTGRLEYSFDLLTSANVTGPGFSVVKPYHTYYGPDSLGAYGQPDDTITYGPDNVLNGITGFKGIAANAAYLGTGTVNLSYSISGGLTTTQGGLNYSQKIQTTYWGDFTLTYYWCPFVPLALSVDDFTATPDGHAILLQWIANINPNNSNYEIQISTDGKNFAGVTQTQPNPDAAAPTAKYQYKYYPDQTDVDKLYFRIREISATGKIAYSQVLVVDKNGSGGPAFISYQVYPNPVTNSLSFRFNSGQNGRFKLELVNTAGQVVQQKSVTLTGTNEIPMELRSHPAKGLYFLRTTDLTHDKQYTSKVYIN